VVPLPGSAPLAVAQPAPGGPTTGLRPAVPVDLALATGKGCGLRPGRASACIAGNRRVARDRNH
jgi:hypothetical protein